MKHIAALILTLVISAPAWAQVSDAAPDPNQAPAPKKTYQQPYPHSSGAELLPFCEQTDDVVKRLRCDYYVQGVADLATIPQSGKPMACIPRGKSRSELILVAVNYFKQVAPDKMESESAASLILSAFKKAFPCLKKEEAGAGKKGAGKAMSEAMRKALQNNKAVLKAMKKRMKENDGVVKKGGGKGLSEAMLKALRKNEAVLKAVENKERENAAGK